MNGLDGKIALVTAGGTEVGRAVALALAARGVRVVVTGHDERALGETVGEIAYGGGKARHVVADVSVSSELAAAVARAVDVFGGLDIMVVSDEVDDGRAAHRVSRAFEVATKERASRLIATSWLPARRAEIVGLVHATAHELAAAKATCNAIFTAGDVSVSDEVGALAAFLCSSDAAGITGQTISIAPARS